MVGLLWCQQMLALRPLNFPLRVSSNCRVRRALIRQLFTGLPERENIQVGMQLEPQLMRLIDSNSGGCRKSLLLSSRLYHRMAELLHSLSVLKQLMTRRLRHFRE